MVVAQLLGGDVGSGVQGAVLEEIEWNWIFNYHFYFYLDFNHRVEASDYAMIRGHGTVIAYIAALSCNGEINKNH